MDYLERSGDSILYPITDITMTEILSHREEMPKGTSLPFDNFERYMAISDKANLVRIARELKVPIPDTLLSTDHENQQFILDSASRFGFPLVVKSSVSKIRTESGWRDAKVHYANDREHLREILSLEMFREYPYLIQKRIIGPGIGIFLLMKEGEVLAKFAHRRIREKPPSGGVSVLSESIDVPREAGNAAVRVLEKVGWTGVAMVEFKIDQEENIAKLLEVNARFWGSLQLSISSGVDFPYLLYRMALGERIEPSQGYTVGLRSRWELGDLDHLLIRWLKNPSLSNLPPNPPGKLAVLKEFICDYFRSSVRNEIFRKDDIKPFFHELKTYAFQLVH
ncbi:MAG: ATP-grasp domain-containing protein [Deltaproteobacteria bacterium]|nr:ATP-grasp domain-containing protein [Deltaproteobacteria bacterium]